MSNHVAITSVGALLPLDLLERVRSGGQALPGGKPGDYGLAPSERLNDQITRSWNRLQGVWQTYAKRLDALPEADTTATTLTREQWLRPLFDELGFAGLSPLSRALEIDGKPYPISHEWNHTLPVHLLGARVPIDRRSKGVAGAATVSPHGLMQEFLNRSPQHLWGIISNGRLLRLVRDNVALTRQSYVEFDLEAIFSAELYSDFVVLWLSCHRTRFDARPPELPYVEQWRQESVAQGVRALDKLRDGVEAAMVALGEGFVAHENNRELRRALREESGATEELKKQILRIVYRLMFLLVAESRDLLHPPKASATAKGRYQEFYSLARLRHLASQTRGSKHVDLWVGLKIVMEALYRHGSPSLGLSALGSFLWSPESIPLLAEMQIDNQHLLRAVHALCFFRDRDERVQRSIDYRNLGAEELGSIYESLLELHAEVNAEARTFRLNTAAGNERKTTGSYYTPTSLIQSLLDTALDPVLDEAEKTSDPEAALLALKVFDPAAGSGHFLIAAAHRIAARLASWRANGGEPTPAESRAALRDVVSRCIYAIDINEMAVELCKFGLWLEATEPGKPLSFIDHHIVCGNALLGTTPALLAAGVPDAAFKALTGDNKAFVTALKKRNKDERENSAQGRLFEDDNAQSLTQIGKELAAINSLEDVSAATVISKEQAFAKLQQSPEYSRARLAANAWCAAFVAPKRKGEPQITDRVVRRLGDLSQTVPVATYELVRRLANQYRFTHLHLAFPDVFSVPEDPDDATSPQNGWSGGFDVVLGNPPWDQIQYDPRETFAISHPEITTAPNMTKRNKLIRELEVSEPAAYLEYLSDVRRLDGVKHFMHESGRYPLSSVGRLNTAPLFVELMWTSISARGRCGVVTPSGLATDSFTQGFFNTMVSSQSLASFFDFENRQGIFPGIDSRMKFALLTLVGSNRSVSQPEFTFFAHNVADLDDKERRVPLSQQDLALLNPNTRTSPIFRNRRDAEITKGIYRRIPILDRDGDPDGNPWGFRGQLMFMMNTDSNLFRTREELLAEEWKLEGNHFIRGDERYLPLYEAKMVHHFDHRWATYDGAKTRDLTLAEKQDPTFLVQPRYWVAEAEVEPKIQPGARWLSGWRNISRSTDLLPFIFSTFPRSAVGNSFTVLNFGVSWFPSWLHSVQLSSFPLTYVAASKIGGANVNMFISKQLPVLPPSGLEPYHQFLRPYLLELSYTAWDMAGFAADLGYFGPPFHWDEERRAVMRAELDALMFHLYGIEFDDVDYILDTFPIVKSKDEKAHGEYRTKRLILERYEAMAKARRDSHEYQSILDPPPAHPSQAHEANTRPTWADWYQQPH